MGGCLSNHLLLASYCATKGNDVAISFYGKNFLILVIIGIQVTRPRAFIFRWLYCHKTWLYTPLRSLCTPACTHNIHDCITPCCACARGVISPTHTLHLQSNKNTMLLPLLQWCSHEFSSGQVILKLPPSPLEGSAHLPRKCLCSGINSGAMKNVQYTSSVCSVANSFFRKSGQVET